jgi:hypothetical protein
MNKKYPTHSIPVRDRTAAREGAQARFARQIVACLNHDAGTLDADLSERLRFARERALERAQLVRANAAPAHGVSLAGAGTAIWNAGADWGLKVASLVPLAALACGLVLIQQWQTKAQISVAAQVDAALLADDLPPTAYRDPAFVEFLKSPPRE